MNKTPEQIVIQKAIVCLYLRKRRARKYLNLAGKNLDIYICDYQIEQNEAHNALESVKRVLWHDDWN